MYENNLALFIDGGWCAGSEGKGGDVINPANEEVLGYLPHASKTDLDRFEAGWIGINSFTPFLADAPGGGYKESGFGLEGGPEGLDAYMHTKFVSQTVL